MRVLFVVRRPGSGSARIRVEGFRPALAALGIDSDVVAWGAAGAGERLRRPARLVAAARRADVVVVQKPNLPATVLSAVCRANPRLVVDVDDAVWATGVAGRSEAPGRYAARFDAALARARLVVAASEHLGRAVAHRRGDVAVEVIRPSVDLADRAVASGTGGGVVPPVVGWIGGAGNQADLTPEVRQALAGWCERHRGDVVVVSNEAPEMPGVPVRFRRWSAATEAADVAGFTIGIMPLRDDERSAGRGGFKAIQYLAAGVPVVASPVGAALEVVADGRHGLLATGAAGWSDALDRLTCDRARRQRLGAAGRAWVAEHASVEANAPRWASLLEGVAAS